MERLGIRVELVITPFLNSSSKCSQAALKESILDPNPWDVATTYCTQLFSPKRLLESHQAQEAKYQSLT